MEATPTTEDTSEAPDASQSPPEPTLGSIPVSAETLMDIYDSSREDEEEADELDEFEQRIEDIDADFEAYLSSQARMDRPMP